LKTKVQIDNKSRIEEGLDPIQPSETTVEFSLGELSTAERKWVAKHYSDHDASIGLGTGTRRSFLLVVRTEEKDIISVIRAYIGKQEAGKIKADGLRRKSES
jgi:hypothetical protein